MNNIETRIIRISQELKEITVALEVSQELVEELEDNLLSLLHIAKQKQDLQIISNEDNLNDNK